MNNKSPFTMKKGKVQEFLKQEKNKQRKRQKINQEKN